MFGILPALCHFHIVQARLIQWTEVPSNEVIDVVSDTASA